MKVTLVTRIHEVGMKHLTAGLHVGDLTSAPSIRSSWHAASTETALTASFIGIWPHHDDTGGQGLARQV
jgi:hypothetical protein